MRAPLPLVALSALTVALGGCQLERLFGADEVGAGVARLSVRNMSVLTNIISNDTTCGFESDAVKLSAVLAGEVGGPGTVTTKVEGCRVAFEQPTEVDLDCNEVRYTAKGAVTVTGTRVVRGTLTGNPASPVIPEGPDAVVIELGAEFKDFIVNVSNSPNSLTIKSGATTFIARPHLAQSASLGVCAIPTRDITMEAIRWKAGGKGFVETPERSFDVDINGSSINAQVGEYKGVENALSGSVLVWDHEVPLPPKDEPILDPDYDRKFFHDSYQCKTDIKTPSEYVCLDVKPQLAQGAAALTVNNVGNLLSALAEDTQCGFKSAAGMRPVVEPTGELGRDGGEVIYRVTDCKLSFPSSTFLSRNCKGTSTFAEGNVTITAEMHLRGIRSGDPLEPIVPTSRTPAEIRFRAVFDNFKASNDATDQSLQIVDGSMTGKMIPRMGIDAKTGACALATPNVTFSELAYDRATALLSSGGNTFKLALGVSSLDAQNGSFGDRTNYLAGTIFVDGVNYSIPVRGDAVLDPQFNQTDFEASYACTPDLVLAPNEEDCSFKKILGENAARLIIQTTGTVASLTNLDDKCGFENKFVQLRPSDVQGGSGEFGSMTWNITDCHVGAVEASVLPTRNPASNLTDCAGGQTLYQGFAGVDAVRVVEGEREKKFFFIDSIVPRDREAVEIQLHGVQLDEFASWSIPPQAFEPKGVLEIHTGTLNAIVEPILGEQASNEGTFDVPTPIARMRDVVVLNANVTLSAQGKTFNYTIDSSNLRAVNGTYHGESNHLEGEIVVDGVRIPIDVPLNPDFTQGAFDASYQCVDNLRGLVPGGR